MKSSLLFPTLLVAAVSLTTAQAQNIVNQTFDAPNNNRSTQNPPTSLEWGFAPNGSTDNTLLSAASGALVYSATGAIAQYSTAYFTPSGSPVSLLDGDSITLTFNFAFSEIAAVDAGLRFGLFNSGGTRYASGFSSATQLFSNAAVFGAGGATIGYFTEANPGAASGVSNLRVRNAFGAATPFSGGGALGTTNPAAYLGLVANTSYTASLTITRSGLSSIVSSTVNGFTVGGTVASGGQLSFDTISIFTGGAAVPASSAFTIDNVNVTVTPVPEPSTYAAAIGALLVGVMVLRRRRAARVA